VALGMLATDQPTWLPLRAGGRVWGLRATRADFPAISTGEWAGTCRNMVLSDRDQPAGIFIK
jgi:hypothetical protein